MGDVTGAKPRRIYDKGERRHKHVGSNPFAEIVFEHDKPKRAIGKCPNDIGQTTREALLQEAIPAPNGDRDVDYPKTLYAVHDGVIYQAQTSDAGRSYHAYPYHGPLAGRLANALWLRTKGGHDERAFEVWVKAHVQVRGQWK